MASGVKLFTAPLSTWRLTGGDWLLWTLFMNVLHIRPKPLKMLHIGYTYLVGGSLWYT
jgi:hypothetical protein